MKIVDKLMMPEERLRDLGPITMAVFGDSITHGWLAPNEIDYETVYWNLLRQKLNRVRPIVPVNVINAGIGGITAYESLNRMETQVFSHQPDLLIVCFGLNDVNGTLEEYEYALHKIFERSKELDIDVICLTPNMMNTYVSDDTAEELLEYAQKTATMQSGGRMDLFMEVARRIASEMNIPICDCYALWKEMSQSRDINLLLANRVNHPTREMHELFAEKLFELIMQ